MMYDLDKLDELERAATPAPWTEEKLCDGRRYLKHEEDCITISVGIIAKESDCDFLAALRNDYPEMAAELRRLRAEYEQQCNLLLEGTNLLLNSTREVLRADTCIQKLRDENERLRRENKNLRESIDEITLFQCGDIRGSE